METLLLNFSESSVQEYKIKSFSELHEVLADYRKSNRWVFRGHVNPDWELVPKAGREPYEGTDDLSFFKAWKRRAVEYMTNVPDNDWDWMAIAQHHGLATRLLDWTYNPLVAAYFASTHDNDTDAHIYAFKPSRYLIPENTTPEDYSRISLFKPKGVVPRITRQGGVFTAHGEPTKSLDQKLYGDDVLDRITIKGGYVRELMFELNHYGINSAYIFPDLDGLSKHVNWYTENRNYWAAMPEDGEGEI